MTIRGTRCLGAIVRVKKYTWTALKVSARHFGVAAEGEWYCLVSILTAIDRLESLGGSIVGFIVGSPCSKERERKLRLGIVVRLTDRSLAQIRNNCPRENQSSVVFFSARECLWHVPGFKL